MDSKTSSLGKAVVGGGLGLQLDVSSVNESHFPVLHEVPKQKPANAKRIDLRIMPDITIDITSPSHRSSRATSRRASRAFNSQRKRYGGGFSSRNSEAYSSRTSFAETIREVEENPLDKIRLVITSDHCVWFLNPRTGVARIIAGDPVQ
jgi:hypothetical protein